MERAETVRNLRREEPTTKELTRQRKRERREAMKQLEWLLEGSFYKVGPDSPFDGRVYEAPLGWDVVVICPDSRDPDDPMYREPHEHGILDAWLIRGGELYRFVEASADGIANALP